MTEKELIEQSESEDFDVKYMKELRDYWNAYMFAMINEIYTGIAINLGMKEADAYKLAMNKPDKMQKAKFFESILNRFKSIFKYPVPKFRYKKKIYGSGAPMTPKQWERFNRYIDRYWNKYANTVAEDISVKSHILGKTTTDFREKKKPYQNKSLFQVITDQYNGKMPKTITEAYKKYDFSKSEKNALQDSYSSVAMYVKNTNNEIQEAIRQQIDAGIRDNKSPAEVSSSLYWNVEKNEDLVNKYTAETLRKNWSRISTTEMATIYENGILAPYEAEAMESLKDPSKARYFVRSGGNCDWCRSVRGTIVRLMPTAIMAGKDTEKLSDIGIKDPNTNIATWIGKNNIGRKQKDWWIAVPGHPNNVATFQPIDLKTEYYNPKTDDVEHRQEKYKFVPQMTDYTEKIKQEKKERKPQKIGNDLVQFNNNIYQAVDAGEYNFKLEEWRKDPKRPIPVNRESPSYKRIIEAAQ